MNEHREKKWREISISFVEETLKISQVLEVI